MHAATSCQHGSEALEYANRERVVRAVENACERERERDVLHAIKYGEYSFEPSRATSHASRRLVGAIKHFHDATRCKIYHWGS